MSGLVVIGVGPGIGRAVAERFGTEGMAVALVSRSEPTLRQVAESVTLLGGPVFEAVADSSDEGGLRAALDAAANEFGPPEVLVYNAAMVRKDRPGELSTREHLDAWAVNVVGALTAATHVAPGMVRRGGGSIIITGGMPVPEPERVSLSLGKAGVRALVELLDTHY
jgi:NAD(P)-dependent dehydrogenase (short-subunit alcohol dehydrogenase family)